jgi:hypothetical protein
MHRHRASNTRRAGATGNGNVARRGLASTAASGESTTGGRCRCGHQHGARLNSRRGAAGQRQGTASGRRTSTAADIDRSTRQASTGIKRNRARTAGFSPPSNLKTDTSSRSGARKARGNRDVASRTFRRVARSELHAAAGCCRCTRANSHRARAASLAGARTNSNRTANT